MYARNNLAVWAYRSEDGHLHIDGQDLASPISGDEYEYFLTVPSDEIPTLTTALGSVDADILDLLEEHGEHIVQTGERRWLRSLGVEPGFASWG